MNERLFVAELGDWSNDGHGMTDTIVVKLSGADVSDEMLSRSYANTVALLGRSLEDVCEEYEQSSIDLEYYEACVDAGFVPLTGVSLPGAKISIEDTVDEAMLERGYRMNKSFAAIELLMFYVGREVQDFTWEPVKLPALMGGRSILSDSSFGYGLYQ